MLTVSVINFKATGRTNPQKLSFFGAALGFFETAGRRNLGSLPRAAGSVLKNIGTRIKGDGSVDYFLFMRWAYRAAVRVIQPSCLRRVAILMKSRKESSSHMPQWPWRSIMEVGFLAV